MHWIAIILGIAFTLFQLFYGFILKLPTPFGVLNLEK